MSKKSGWRGWFGGGVKGFIEVLKSERVSVGDAKYNEWADAFNFEEYSEKYDTYTGEYPKVKSAVLTVSGQTVADGIYVVPAKEYDTKTGKRTVSTRSRDAAKLIEELNERLNMAQQIFITAERMVKYGTCFWEKGTDGVYGFEAAPIVQQKYMKPIYRENTIEIVGWELKSTLSRDGVKFDNESVVVFPWNPGKFYPYGTSLLSGIDREIEIQNQVTENVIRYLKRQAWSIDVLTLGDKEFIPGETETTNFRNHLVNRQIGDTIVTNYPTNKNTLGGAQMETRMVPEILKFTDDQIADSLLVPPLSRLYNSTQASAQSISAWSRASLITPLQAIIAKKIEDEIYFPYLEAKGFSKKQVPHIIFDPPESGREKEADYWMKLVQFKIATPEQAAEELGIAYDSQYFKELESKANQPTIGTPAPKTQNGEDPKEQLAKTQGDMKGQVSQDE